MYARSTCSDIQRINVNENQLQTVSLADLNKVLISDNLFCQKPKFWRSYSSLVSGGSEVPLNSYFLKTGNDFELIKQSTIKTSSVKANKLNTRYQNLFCGHWQKHETILKKGNSPRSKSSVTSRSIYSPARLWKLYYHYSFKTFINSELWLLHEILHKNPGTLTDRCTYPVREIYMPTITAGKQQK